MSNLKKYALEQTAVLHLRDGNDELMFADGADGKPDESKPMRVWLSGPGTKKFAGANVAQTNRNVDRLKKRGKSDLSVEDQTKDRAIFLAACTESMENIEYEKLAGDAMHKAIYSDLELCFIPAQIDKWLADTSNFTKGSATT